MTEVSLVDNQTFPGLLLKHSQNSADSPAFREKYLGIWQTYSWRESAEQVRALACGFAVMGLKRGDTIAIIGDNRPQLYWVFLAAQSIGAVPVPMYQDGVAEELQYVLNHAGVRFAVVEDQEQTDKLFLIKDRCSQLEEIIYKDSRGMQDYNQPFVHNYTDVQERGRAYDEENPDFFQRELAVTGPDDVAGVFYTSGTTGNPKGVQLTFSNLLVSANRFSHQEALQDDERQINYAPMAWVGDHFFLALALSAGYSTNCPESRETLLTDLKEIGPTIFFGAPALWEGLLTTITIRMEDAGRFKRGLFRYFIDVAQRAGTDLLDRRPVGLADRLRYWLGEVFIYGPLKNNLGLSHTRLAITGGAPLGENTFSFYRSIGINLKQIYGQTECSAYATRHHNGDARQDTVGPPCEGVEIRIADSGEILVKSPGNFAGYFKNPEATRETLTEDGWLRTGDAGIMTDDGHLKVIDRANDVGALNDGTLFAPQYIENKLKFFPYIREAVALGNARNYVTVFINIDLEAMGNFAERIGLSYSGYTDLSQRDEVYDLIRQNVEEVNQDLTRDSNLASSQIRRFIVLHKELDADDGELTRTRKVRREFVGEKYRKLIDALYSDQQHVEVESEVTFEDGSKGSISADLKIYSLQVEGSATGSPGTAS
ncbi:MAG TPA: long-chain fatty acid--CoA ligase [Gammaproteobacteria bacterium]|jgi:long-chain acyl-CoA synthetase|nr:long-chain fatty acid--CoA ligase [Gammaproteobacteria bacterium]|tara:strand:- start:1079 stop:3043 length:1965 start_codon:yes stop_codon:yes gene_type:complete